MACLAFPCRAQKGGSNGGGGNGGTGGGGGNRGSTGGGFPIPGTSTLPNVYSNTPSTLDFPVNAPSTQRPVVSEVEKCLPWNTSEGRDTAVSVTRLKVPGKARSEFEKACDLNNKTKLDDAEAQVRAAIDNFKDYSAAWVLLGVILEEQHKRPEAREACEHAMTIDTKYAPAYLCQAEFSTREQEWEQVSNAANTALGLNTAGDGYAYYYLATAQFHSNHVAEAKKTALQASEIDVNHEDVPLYFLLAQIYDAEGNKPEAETQLRQILKHHADRQQEAAAKEYLAQLQSQPATK